MKQDILCFYFGRDRLCAVCEKQDWGEIFRPTKAHRAEKYNSFFTEAFWRTSVYCSFCRLAFESFRQDPGHARICQSKPTGWFCKVDPVFFMTAAYNTRSSVPKYQVTRQVGIALWSECGEFRPNNREHRIQVLADISSNNYSAKLNLGRRVEPSRVNIGLLKRWITACVCIHGAICNPTKYETTRRFTLRLVDVRRRCIVIAPDDCEYVALSYTWGDPMKNKHLKLTGETLRWLQSEGALSDGNEDIPTTIKDALYIADLLQEKYLWVDAICIQQDNEDDKKVQIPNMDRIYGCAKLTIVAGAGSNAWAGLPGVGSRVKPRTTHQSFSTVKGLPLVTTLESYHGWRRDSTWDSRGWTLQEKVLSKRLLIFGSEQVYFQCKTSQWCEDTICENLDENVISETLALDNYVGGTPFTQYEGILMHLAHRKFGFRDDILNAFRGLENHLQQTLSNEFHWGLPVSMFDAALGWYHPYHYPARRRTNFPSWSWTGWDYSGIRIPGHHLSHPSYQSVGREVKWYRLCENPPRRQTLDALLPEFVKPPSGKTMGRLNYQEPMDQITTVSGPLPSQPSGPYLSQMLQFWTSSAQLKVDRQESENLSRFALLDRPVPAQQYNNILLNIRGMNGTIIGHITLDRDWRSSHPNELEFIVIARYCQYAPTEMEPEGFYVLLIEWISNVAYRVQTPEKSISKEHWADLKPEWKIITLA